MDLSYAKTNITGYKGHLAVQTVKLPLKYPSILDKYAPNEQFHRQLANTGDIINLSQIHPTFIDHISYLVLNDMKTVVFTPLNAQVNNFDLKFQSLQVVLPHEIKSSKCISVYYEKPQSEDEGWVIMDLIDENYLFITLKLSLTDFIVENSKKGKLSLNNFDQWGKISIPYSFELRSPPSFMKAIDSLNVIVSLKDGGLLHLQRSDHLNDFDVYNFNDPTSLLPLNFVSGLFRKDSSNQDIVLDGVSSNSLVDLVAVNDKFIVTLTVDKVLKFWNLENHQQSRGPIELNDTKVGRDDSAWLTSISARYLQIVESESSGKTYLICHFTTTSNNFKQIYNEMGLLFKAWEVLDYKTQIELVSLDRLTFQPQLPDLLISRQNDEDNAKFHNTIWFVQDFKCENRGEYINYHILWKSNTSSILVTYKTHFDNGAVASINWSQPNNIDSIPDTSPYRDIEYYSNKILNSEKYDDLVITTSLNIFREYMGLENVRNTNSIRQLVMDTVNKAVNESQDLKSCWYKLDSLCEELNKIGEESLAFCITNNSTILSLNINSMSVFRYSHYYERFYHNKPSSSEGKLAAILERLSITLSPKTYSKVYRGILNTDSKLTAKEATELYDTILNSKISTHEISLIMSELESIPDILDVITSVIDSRVKPNTLDESMNARKLNTSSSIGTLTKLNSIATFRNIKRQHESILLNLVVLFLICEVNEQILLLLNKLVERLSTYVIVDCVFNTCFESDNDHAEVESFNLSNSENSLFWTGLVNRNPQLNNLIRVGRLTESYDDFYGHVISTYDQFILDIIIELINHGEGLSIKENFLSKLNQTKIIDKFLIGLVYLINNEPLEFFQIFEKHEFFKFDNDSIREDLKSKFLNSLSINPSIKSFLSSIFLKEFDGMDYEIEKANYFHALSELSKSQAKDSRHRLHHRQKLMTPSSSTISIVTSNHGQSSTVEGEFIHNALKFEKIAVENLKQINNPDETIILKIDQYYLNIFEMALSSLNYDVVYECLSNLSSSKISTIYNYKDLLRRFINNLMGNQRISIIFPPNSNSLYSKHYLLIDSILLELANNELTLANSLKCYEYLYTWRLFGPTITLNSSQLADKRGAAESLYMFITRFKYEQKNLLTSLTSIVEDIKQYKLKILELYMIILNCLKSFNDDADKWIIKSKSADSLTVIRLDELNLEYYEWLRQLEDDLN